MGPFLLFLGPTPAIIQTCFTSVVFLNVGPYWKDRGLFLKKSFEYVCNHKALMRVWGVSFWLLGSSIFPAISRLLSCCMQVVLSALCMQVVIWKGSQAPSWVLKKNFTSKNAMTLLSEHILRGGMCLWWSAVKALHQKWIYDLQHTHGWEVLHLYITCMPTDRWVESLKFIIAFLHGSKFDSVYSFRPVQNKPTSTEFESHEECLGIE